MTVVTAAPLSADEGTEPAGDRGRQPTVDGPSCSGHTSGAALHGHEMNR
jgi:hypothetical protein